MALTWTAAWPMWTAVKHNKRKHLRRQDSGIFHEVHVYRDAVAGGAAEDFCISHRCDAQKNVGPLIWRMFIGCLSGLFMHELPRLEVSPQSSEAC